MKVDVVVLGAGAAGLAAAEGAVAAGASVAVVEKGTLGGECPNFACVPTKTMLASARLYRAVQGDGARLGLRRTERVSFDWTAAIARKNAVVQGVTHRGRRYAEQLAAMKVKLVTGEGVFAEPGVLTVGSQRILYRSVVIATGASEAPLDIPGMFSVDALTYKDVLQLKRPPQSAVIVGGGAVGVEMAVLLASIGVPVTILEAAPHLLFREDEEVAMQVQSHLRTLGVVVRTGAVVMAAKKERHGVTVTWQRGTRTRESATAEALIVATGRRPNLASLDVAALDVALDHCGVPKKQSNTLAVAKNVYLAGDVGAQPQFTATAHYAGWTAGWNAAQTSPRARRTVDWSIVPRVIFTDPEFAAVGATAQELATKRIAFEAKAAPFALLARSAADATQTGLAKVLLDPKTNRILGASIFGPRAGELIHEIALAMRLRATWSDVTAGLRAFPSYSEIFGFLR